VTAKSSILPFGTCFINSASTRAQFCVLPWEICFAPRDLACERNWLSAEKLALTAKQKSAEGIVGCKLGRRPERFPSLGLKEGRSHLSSNGASASVGRRPLWDERAVGEMKEDAPVQEQWLMERVLEKSNLICALRQVKSNAGSPGADGMSVEALSGYLRQHLSTSLEFSPEWSK